MTKIIDFQRRRAEHQEQLAIQQVRRMLDSGAVHIPTTDESFYVQRRKQVEPSTETGKNSRLRKERREVWRAAEATTRYWRARLDMEHAISMVVMYGTDEAKLHPEYDQSNHMKMVDKYREMLVRQLLTPAPDSNAVVWKKAAFERRDHLHTDVKPERIERAIAADEEWLATHPTKRTNSETMARRRAFKEAMRKRIREVAASRNLSEQQIKPALTLKHHHIGLFCDQYGVQLEWLLEGRGRMFENDPIELGPNMTGTEFATVVSELPIAAQREIAALMREMTKGKP
ncbi:MAG TPA: hypothetical protein VFB02_16410 [Bradyrhizobium sp.]|nr:hypothetical protein [Bradyrhizobium sp.]